MVIVLCNVKYYCYMKNKNLKQSNSIGEGKSYIPDETIVNFIQGWLQLHKKKAVLAKDGKELSEEDKKKIREFDRMKVYILDKFIFQSMANLIYFFEAIASSRRLSEAFEDEIAELLDPGRTREAAEFSGNNMRFNSMQFRSNNLARLIIAMLGIHQDRSDNRKPATDFRVGLMYQIQNIIGDMMDSLLSNEFSTNQIWRSAMDDYSRMKGWLALLARSIEDYRDENDRKIGFSSIWWSNKASIQEMEF